VSDSRSRPDYTEQQLTFDGKATSSKAKRARNPVRWKARARHDSWDTRHLSLSVLNAQRRERGDPEIAR
jgi:hypothetical protein